MNTDVSLLSRGNFPNLNTYIIIDCAFLNSPPINIQSEGINDCANMRNIKRALAVRAAVNTGCEAFGKWSFSTVNISLKDFQATSAAPVWEGKDKVRSV